MFTTQFGRIFWKEYRVHRALWLVSLSFGCLIQLLCRIFQNYGESREVLLFQTPMFISVLYALGCGALLFASEREERTSDWLLCLSAKPGSLLAAKILFAISSVIVVQFSLLITAYILSAGIHHPNMVQQYLYVSAYCLPFGTVVLIWSMLGSLLSRRVIASIPAMVFGYVMTAIVPTVVLLLVFECARRYIDPYGYFISLKDFEELIWSWIATSTLIVSVASLDFWLGWRWCQGKYLDGSLFERLAQWFQTRWLSRTSRTVRRSRLPVHAEYEQSWRRTWQRLVWQERYRDSMYLGLLATGCVIGLPILIPHNDFFSFAVIAAFIVIWIPLAMGVIGFESQPNCPPSRFLTYCGASPAGIWLAKQFVWLPRAFWVTGVVVLFNGGLAALRFLIFLVFPNTAPSILRITDIIKSAPDIPLWYVLLSYSCGQLASSLIRRVVLAGAVSVFLNLIAIGWIWLVVFLDVPRWWTLGFPVLSMLSITFWQMKPRMMEDQSWPRFLKLAAALVLAPSLSLAGFAWYRVAEVADIPQEVKWMDDEWRMHVDKQRVLRNLSDNEKRVAASIDRFMSTVAIGTGAESNLPAFLDLIDALKLDSESLSEGSNKDSNEFKPFGQRQSFGQRRSRWFQMKEWMLSRADQEPSDEKALEYYLSLLKIARLHASRRGIREPWCECSRTQYETLEHLVQWANRPSQTPDAVRSAALLIDLEMCKFSRVSDAIVASYLVDRKVLDKPTSTESFEYMYSRCSGFFDTPSPSGLVLMHCFPWEKSRLATLMEREAEAYFVQASMIEGHHGGRYSTLELTNGLNQSGFPSMMSLEDSSADEVTKDRFANVAPYKKDHRAISVQLLMIRNLILQRATEIRAALTRLRLIAHRLEHGQLPDHLIELKKDRSPDVTRPSDFVGGLEFVDPYSNRLFEYYPLFLLSQGVQKVTAVPVGGSGAGLFLKNSSPGISFTLQELMNDTAPKAMGRRVFNVPRDSYMLVPVQYDSTLFPIPPKATQSPVPIQKPVEPEHKNDDPQQAEEVKLNPNPEAAIEPSNQKPQDATNE